MNLHLVGGFLGSGKTTAIAGAAKHLMQQGRRVGVITNDQGRYLVDTAFFKLEDVPSVEVTGGCFCCHYDLLDQQLDRLIEEARPDVVFAESVGSCADLVATVLKPMIDLRQRPASFSVFTDARLLRRFVQDQPLPFSDEIVYIFAQQITEAGLLIVNKADLLTTAQIDEVIGLCRSRWPDKQFRAQNSRDAAQIAAWVDLIGAQSTLPTDSLDIDYARYATAEARLGWLNRELTLHTGSADARAAVIALLESLHAGVSRLPGAGIGHLKCLVTAGDRQAKISFTALDTPGWQQDFPPLAGPEVRVLVNARIEAAPPVVDALVAAAADQVAVAFGITVVQGHGDAFQPGEPRPTHRYA